MVGIIEGGAVLRKGDQERPFWEARHALSEGRHTLRQREQYTERPSGRTLLSWRTRRRGLLNHAGSISSPSLPRL